MVRPGAGSDPTPPCSHLVCRLPCPYRRAASVAERADRALCSLVAQVPSTRRALRCQVSCSRRIFPASHLTCSRTHASPALGRSPLIGAKVITSSTSSSASAASESSPRLCRRLTASRSAGARGSPQAVGCGLRVCVCVRGPQAHRGGRRVLAVAVQGGRSSCGQPLGREPPRRGRRQGGPMGQPRRPLCGAFSGAWTNAGFGVACAGVAVDPAQCFCVEPLLQV